MQLLMQFMFFFYFHFWMILAVNAHWIDFGEDVWKWMHIC